MLKAKTEVEPQSGHYTFRCEGSTPADNLLAMLGDSLEANQIIYFVDQSVRNAIEVQGVGPIQRIQILDALLSTAEKIRTQPEAILQYAKAIIEVLKTFEPTDQQAFLTATSTSRNSAPAMGAQALSDRLSFVISKIAGPCFAAKDEFSARKWFEAGRTLSGAIEHIDSIRNFDSNAYDLLQAKLASQREQIIAGNRSTVRDGIYELLKTHIPSGSTIECTETEKSQDGYRDITYQGELTVHLVSGKFRSVIHTEQSVERPSSPITTGGNAFDQNNYTYVINKAELLKRCVS